MNSDLIMGIVFILLALVMVLCIVVNCVNANWVALPICGFAFGMNITSAIGRFREYKWQKEYKKRYSLMSMRHWSDYDEDEF